MMTIEALKNYGANTQEGLARCMNNESFYIRLVGMGLNDANFGKLKEAAAAGNVKEAFEAAHALKGVTGNLALTPIFMPVSELTELLRGKEEMPDVDSLVNQVLDQWQKALALNA
ncbi:MAG: Hpt domain-containing protein [Clostridiales bacterium]|nr:Hpt domain-containing protein [Clostridiales bacterium]